MKKRLSLVGFVLIYLSCIAIMDYPFVARIYNERVQGKAVLEYEKKMEEMDSQTCNTELSKAEKYNEELASGVGQRLEDVFGEDRESHREYKRILNTGNDGIMGWIEIPAIGVTLPVYHGSSDRILQKGAGHLEGTSLPVGGEDTHTVISAHRGLPSKKMFTDLDRLHIGDIFYIHVLQNTLAYQVTKVEIVTPDDTKALCICPEKDLATLVTCTPYGINTHRMYVHGQRIPYEESMRMQKEQDDAGKWILNYWWMILSTFMIVWLGILVMLFRRQNKSKTKRKGGRKNRYGRKKISLENGRGTACGGAFSSVRTGKTCRRRKCGKVDI